MILGSDGLHLHVDVETRSEMDIKRGAQCYALHPTTQLLCMAWALGTGEPELWLPGDPVPEVFRVPNTRLLAFNAEFEIAVFEHKMGTFGFPVLPDERWQCVMSDALALSLPGNLDQCGEALQPLGLKYLKDPKGKNLINKLCKPKKPTKKSPGIWREKEDFLEDYLALYEYCKQDVRTERAIFELLPTHATG